MMNVTEPNASEMLKESSLEAIGYICHDIVNMLRNSVKNIAFIINVVI